MSIVLFFAFLGIVILKMKKSVNNNLIIILIPCIIILLPFGIVYGARHQYLVKEKKLMKAYLKEKYDEDFNIIKMKRLLVFFNDVPSTSAVAVLDRDKKIKFPISRDDDAILKNGKPFYYEFYGSTVSKNEHTELLKSNLNFTKISLISLDFYRNYHSKPDYTIKTEIEEKLEPQLYVTCFILTDEKDKEVLEKTIYSIIEKLREKQDYDIGLRIAFLNNSFSDKLKVLEMKYRLNSLKNKYFMEIFKPDLGYKIYSETYKNDKIIRYDIEHINKIYFVKDLEKYID